MSDHPGLPSLPLPPCLLLPSLGPRTIFIACAPGSPTPRAQAGLGRNVVSLAPSSSFVYFLPCTQALLEPLPFSILDPNSNKTVTKDPGPCGSLPPCPRTGVGTGGARQAEGSDTAPLHRYRGLDLFSSLPSPVSEKDQQEVRYVL